MIAARLGARDDGFCVGQNVNIHTGPLDSLCAPGVDPVCATRCFPLDFVCPL